VHAAGINATEWKLRKGVLNFGAVLPQTTGRDVAGVVDEVGEGVTDVAVGDRVFGVSDDGAGGALIEAGRFWLPVERTYPLEAISEAHRVSEHGHVRGRLVLVIR
jgi:NADPH:quinone reductase-like Zn-dependent oxidoreductase